MQEQNRPMSIEVRIRRLERANRTLAIGLCAVSGLIIFLGAAAADQVPDVIRTRSLEVVNEAGSVQARITASGEGASMELLDESGVARINLGHGPEDTALYIKDADGTTRIGVAQFAHGGGGFALHGEESKGASVLYFKGGKGSLSFYGTDGTVVHRVPEKP